MNSGEYWEKRIANQVWKKYNTIESKNRALIDMYEDATASIREELYALGEKFEKDGVVSRSEVHKYNRLKNVEAKYNQVLQELGAKVEQHATDQMQEGFRELYPSVGEVVGAKDMTVPQTKVMEEMLKKPWRGSNFSERLWGNQAKLARVLNTDLRMGIEQGKTIAEIAIQAKNTMNKGFNVVHRLIRTETMHYLNQAAIKSYQDADINKVQMWAAMDERVCDECGDYHEKIFPIDKAPILPFHPNCRCTYLPVIEDDVIEDGDKTTDYMGKSEDFGNDEVKIKAYEVDGAEGVFTQTYSTDAQNTIEMLKEMQEKGTVKDLSQVVVAKDLHGIAAYDHAKNIMYVNEKISNQSFIRNQLSEGYFVAENAEDIIKHEMFHKKHWDFIMTQGENHDIVKQSIETDLHKYVVEQQHSNFNYIKTTVSQNAKDCFVQKKTLNELIADVLLQNDKDVCNDKTLLELVRRCVE